MLLAETMQSGADEPGSRRGKRAGSRGLLRRSWALVGALVALAAGCGDRASGVADLDLRPCRLKSVEIELRCATLQVPEDRRLANDATARRIPIRVAVVPALARKPEPDPVFVFAGGPGQAATDVAAQMVQLFSKLNRDRDIVLVDQRGTGASHRLSCADETASQSLAEAFDVASLDARVATCAARLARTADLTRYTTTLAMQDVDEVRERLGYRRINLWGASYGTRAALEYLRLFPDRVRTATLDGVAPASLKLPLSFGVDTHAAVVGLVAACDREPACAARSPHLGRDIETMLARLAAGPLAAEVASPLTGRRERVVLTGPGFASMLRGPLYTSLTAALLPAAVGRAATGDFDALAALTSTVGGGLEENLALGMHLSVVCAEDLPAITATDLDAARAEALRSRVDGRPNPFALVWYDQYRRFCARWPAGRAEAAYFVPLAGRPGADVPALLLSGGIDPATPPAEAEALVAAMPNARHVVAPNVGHGVSLQGCASELIERFVRKADAKALDPRCLTAIPRPTFFAPIVEARRDNETAAVP